MTKETIDAMVQQFYEGLRAARVNPFVAAGQARALRGSLYRTYGIKEAANVPTN